MKFAKNLVNSYQFIDLLFQNRNHIYTLENLQWHTYYIYYMKHKSPYYKLCADNYYLNHDVGYDNTCKIFDCKSVFLNKFFVIHSALP